jgi:hypothetical protein
MFVAIIMESYEATKEPGGDGFFSWHFEFVIELQFAAAALHLGAVSLEIESFLKVVLISSACLRTASSSPCKRTFRPFCARCGENVSLASPEP